MKTKTMKLGLETFSYHLALGAGRMDVFDFIRRTHELGLDGVQINMVGRPPTYGHLGGIEPEHLKKVRALIERLGLYVEVDTNQSEAADLQRGIEVCTALGAGVLRTYQIPTGDVRADMAKAAAVLKSAVPLCEKHGVRIAFENHEYETADDILAVLRQVNSPWVGAMCDNGNGMMSWEDPDVTVEKLAPHAFTTHFKDHVVIEEAGRPIVVGVTNGRGSMDLKKHFEILADTSLDHLNIEVCYAYRAPFRRPVEQGGGGVPGAGAFEVLPPPFDPAFIPPRDAPAESLLAWEEQSVRQSVAYMKALRDGA